MLTPKYDSSSAAPNAVQQENFATGNFFRESMEISEIRENFMHAKICCSTVPKGFTLNKTNIYYTQTLLKQTILLHKAEEESFRPILIYYQGDKQGNCITHAKLHS